MTAKHQFKLDPRLAQDSIHIGDFQLSQLRLMNNAHCPWFLLVPMVEQFEFHHLQPDLQFQLLNETTTVASFIEAQFNPDKINSGAIGNIVRQLHIHVIGRFKADPCWPGVVWGALPQKLYTPQQTEVIIANCTDYLKMNSELTFSINIKS